MDGEIAPDSFFRSYLQTDQPVTWAASRVHGITKTDLESAPHLSTLWPQIRSRMSGAVLVGHGAGTERRFLRIFPSHGFGPWLDSLELARRCYPDLKSHRLGDLIDVFELGREMESLCPELRWHDALFDAVAALVLIRHVISSGNLADYPLGRILGISP